MARTAPAPNIPPLPGMCPGAFVAGGGGDGGGGSGKGGKGGDGKQGSKGGKGGEGGEGGGKGSGKCGKGGAGECTNCGHNVSKGDPVDVITGKVFTVPKTDLYLPGLFDLELQRTYTTAHLEVDVGLGFGWRHSLAWGLEEEKGEIAVRTGDGRLVELPRPDVGQTVEAGGWRVLRGAQYYAVLPGNEFVHLFVRSELDERRFELRRILFRDRGHVSLQYDRGRLARVLDSAGRVILLEGTPQGRIASISVPNPQGGVIVFARYAYDSEGNLVAAADADGHTTRYAYDDEHRLTRLEYPSGLVFHYRYDRRGRCVETWGDRADGIDPALADGLSRFLADGTTRAKGIYHVKLEFLDDDCTEVIDSVKTQRFFPGAGGMVGKGVSGTGGVTTREFDDWGNVLSQTDPTGATWTYEYDEDGNLVRELDPEGAEIRVAYDAAGRELVVVDPAGNLTRIERDSFGEVLWVKDANGALLHLERDENGLVTRVVDERGAAHVLDYDDHGNLITRTLPTGGTYRFAYDYWGRMLREADPNGNAYEYRYTDSGLLREVTDPLGRVMTYDYDAMGNVVVERNPDGTAVRREFGGLDWMIRAEQEDGTSIRAGYNREGWLLWIENERGERHTFEHTLEGDIARERTFHGQERKYGYDALGRAIWFDDGGGKFERKLSAAGRILEETSPGGETKTYAYDKRGQLVRATYGGVSFEWQLDPTANVVREVLTIDGIRYAIESERNAAGDRLAYRTTLGLDVRVKRDANGQVSEIWTDAGRALALARNASGEIERWELGGGGAIVDTRDPANRLARRAVVGPGAGRVSEGEPEWLGHGGGGRAYEYTPVDEVRSIAFEDGSSVELEYDARRHVKKRNAGGRIEELFVDGAGNYSEKTLAGAPARTYGPGNQLLASGDCEYEYDDVGRLARKRRRVAGVAGAETIETTRYVWNEWGTLAAVELPDGRRVEYAYDAYARRTSRRVLKDDVVIDHRHYVWDLVSMVHEVVLKQGKPEDVRTYLFEGNDDDVPLAHQAGAGWVHYVHDVNGMPSRLVDGSGRLVGSLGYTLFGRASPASDSAAATPFRFAGQMEDPDTGLHYNRYRYYDPDVGRYISPDPLGIDGGFNLYEYGPNPVAWVDPMGLKHSCDVKGPKDFMKYANGPSGSTFDKDNYLSGHADWNRCPGGLDSQPRCHTEQKFAHDLISGVQKGKVKKGGKYELKGQFPPCPRCHAALMRAAKETNSKIEYKWTETRKDGKKVEHKITYNGKSKDKNGQPKVTGTTTKGQKSGMSANDLVKKYDSKDTKDFSLGGIKDKEGNPWGYQNAKGADDAYSQMCTDVKPPAKKKK